MVQFSYVNVFYLIISLTLSLTVKVIYDLVFEGELLKNKFKFNEYENISIPGAASCESVCLRCLSVQ